jgi:mRNA interferase RelE/StbE
MENYKIELTNTAQKDAKKLDIQIYKRIFPKIKDLSSNPFPAGAKKLVTDDGYRIRIGDYRIVYDVDLATKAIIIYRIKHRGSAYKK